MSERLLIQELRECLKTKFIGRELRFFSSISSTQDEAYKLASKGAPEGTVVIAERQTAGRGRGGRHWVSPSGGLWFSIVLYPGSFSGSLILAIGAAVGYAIRKGTGLPALIKWPNDILVGGRKLAGILLERDTASDFSIIGVGVNVNVIKDELLETGNAATSIREELGRDISQTLLACEILSQIERHYLTLKEKGALPILERWRSISSVLGRQVVLSQGNSEIAGEAVDIDSDGALIIRLDSGIRKRVTSGELSCIPDLTASNIYE